MMKKHHRSQRLEGELQKVLAEIIREDLKDPRLSLISVSGVSVSRDLSFAKVFISHLQEEKAKEGIEALNRAKGIIRKGIGQKLSLRIVPEIAFFLDESLYYSMKIQEKLREISKDLPEEAESEESEES